METQRRAQIRVLALCLAVVTLGYGMIIPILPFYMSEMGAGGTELGLLVASYAVMRLVCGPIWGAISDRVGRKLVLLIGVAGYAITMFWFALATHLWMMFAARILAGMLSSATSPTTMAYIGDSTSEEERSKGMGTLGAAVGLGTVLGPALGGLLASEKLSVPFMVAAGLALLALALVAWLVPESLPVDERHQARRSLALGDFLRTCAVHLKGSWGVLLILTFVTTCGLMLFHGVFGLYALARFDYGPAQVGSVLMVTGLASALAQGALIGPLSRHIGEVRIVQGMSLLSAASLILVSFARTPLSLLATCSLFAMATALLTVALNTLTSQRAVLPQGSAMGLSGACVSLGRIVGPLSAGIAFDAGAGYPFLLGGAVLLASYTVSRIWVR